jgi:epoxide hydrolase-like predicted phosphatase
MYLPFARHHRCCIASVYTFLPVIRDVPPVNESEIDVVFFDWGGVLTDLPSIVIPQVMDEFGIKRIPEEQRSDDAMGRFHQLERGEISLATYLESARRANPGSERLWDPDDEAFVYPRLFSRPAVVGLVGDLREAGYRTALLSNNVAEYWDFVLDTLDVDQLFEETFNSAHVGHRKPERAIYEHALEAMGVSADRSLFLDDNTVNVEGAIGVGMRAIEVNSSDHQMFDELHRALIGS